MNKRKSFGDWLMRDMTDFGHAQPEFGKDGVPATGVGPDRKVDETFRLPPYGDARAKAMWQEPKMGGLCRASRQRA